MQIIILGVNQLEIYFLQYLPQLFNILIAPIVPVVILSNLSYNLVHTQASGGRVFSLLEETHEVVEKTDGKDIVFYALNAKV